MLLTLLDDTNYNSEFSQKYFKNSDKLQRRAFFSCGGHTSYGVKLEGILPLKNNNNNA